jgi:hypothetical protein
MFNLALPDDAEGISFTGGSMHDVDYDIFDSM